MGAAVVLDLLCSNTCFAGGVRSSFSPGRRSIAASSGYCAVGRCSVGAWRVGDRNVVGALTGVVPEESLNAFSDTGVVDVALLIDLGGVRVILDTLANACSSS